MIITLLISNRQSGKSKIAYYEFLKDPEHTMFISLGYKELPKHKNILPCQHFEIIAKTVRAQKINKIIIDNYFDLTSSEMEECYHLINSCNLQEVSLFTTAKTFNGEVVELIKDSKLNKTNLDITLYGREEVRELIHNFVTDPRTKIINENFFLNKDLKREHPMMDVTTSEFTGIYTY